MITDEDIEKIKLIANNLFVNKTHLHIKIVEKRKKVNALSMITGVYDRFMTVSSKVGAYEESFTISYISILLKEFVIDEIQI